MERYKILGQVNVADDAVFETLYTCPVRAETTYTVSGGTTSVTPSAVDVNTQTLVTSIIACNTTALADTFSIRLLPTSGTTPGDEHLLFDIAAIGASETHVLSLGLTLSAGNTLEVTCATSDSISFTATGIEVT